MLRDYARATGEPSYVGKPRAYKDIPTARRAFARRLEAARVDAGFVLQKDFAQALQIEDERYRMWERGDREPDITHLVKIAKLLNRSLDWLVLGERQAPSPRRAVSG